MVDEELQHSILYLPPHEGESISHYLGRWFRQEAVSMSSSLSLSRKLKMGNVLWRWQHFYFNPPNHELLPKISHLTEVEVDRLLQMFPPEDELIKPKPIWLCAACYVEAPYHRICWQFQSTVGCEQHRLRLLSQCPACKEPFPIPASWVEGKCERCGMLFKTMAKRQKQY